ncbi:hypothetical protein NFC73_11615 [Pseudarthrobacter sp. RMG13]|uniref:Uncharacterized protein n=1 Tax=Pseudarthrobacter humi TaxID=2952523 RepID=A0ABT1LPH8_9MICC|nr:hypothetical protein [Pseudarthrobacter humi]MCP9000370.1 hypothetical protein [Pseudarthrobacter humi]
MPQQVVVTETYWCPGAWPWEWFDTCTRRVTKWCYDFSWVEETGYGLASHLKGCENGILYSWWAFSFNIWGSTQYGPGRMCFTSQLSSSGRCAASAVSGLTVTAEAPRIQSMARRQIRGPVHRPLVDEKEQSAFDDESSE